MKLSDKEFPFWAVGKKTKSRTTQKCYRFVRKGERYDEFYYDYIVIINKYGGSWAETSWSAFSRKGDGYFSRFSTSTIRGMGELSTLEAGAKEKFIVELWNLLKGD